MPPPCIGSPFTRQTLALVRNLLQPFQPSAQCREAAVLVALCNVSDVPSLLFEVRGNVREHPHEISFPGGGVDDGESPAAAAVRETEEELGISSDRIEVLGTFGPVESSLSGKRVWPFVGWVHAGPGTLSDFRSNSVRTADGTADGTLPSIDVRSLVVSPMEVRAAFHVPLRDLMQMTRLERALFRDQATKPYFAVAAADYLASAGVDDVPRKEVWGLTGWYLNLFMRVMGWWTPPPA